jgi:hypothetical protein
MAAVEISKAKHQNENMLDLFGVSPDVNAELLSRLDGHNLA